MKLLSYLTLMCLLLTGLIQAQITSGQSGGWADPATWVGGVVPDATTDVVIAAGHTVSVDDETPECLSLSFGGNDALIDMNHDSRLSIYGDMTLFSTDHNVFSAGWSSDNAYVYFVGSGDQVLSGWNTGGSSTSLRDMVIDKPSGKVITDGSGMRFCLQNSLEIISGTFEFAPNDDLEARWASSGNFTNNQNLTITIQADGELLFPDGSGTHFVRSGTGSKPIGPMTVYGEVEFYDASSYDISIAGIDIKDGGWVKIGTGLGSSTYGPEFNPGTITIEDGGELYSITTSDVWFDTTTVIIEDGGSYETSSSTTVFPPTLVNNGKIRYNRNSSTSSSDQTVVDMDYHRVEFSYLSNNTSKIWTLTDNRVVTDSLTTNNSATFVLEADAPYNLTVNGTIRMTSGTIDNSDADASLVLGDGVLISRATGIITDAPVYGGMVDICYSSNSSRVTTGLEMPVADDVLNDLTVSGDEGLDLGANVTANGLVTLTGSEISTGSFTLALADGALLDESAGFIVDGNVAASRDLYQSVGDGFGGIGVEINAEGADAGANLGYASDQRGAEHQRYDGY